MSEENFRPRKISPDELIAAQNKERLEKGQAMRRLVEQNELDPEASDDQESDSEMTAPPFTVSGNVPPQLQEMLAKMGKQKMTDQTQNPPQMPRGPSKAPQRKQQFTNEPSLNYDSAESVRLKEVLDRLKSMTHQFEEVIIPSLGRFYNGSDGPQNGVLHVRRMTGKEEEILATTRYFREGKIVDMILENCVQEKYRPADLLTTDRDYLLVYIRGISYSPDYEVEIKCPACERKFETTVNLNDFPVNDCPEDFTHDSLSGTLPTSGLDFSFKPSRGRDENAIQTYAERQKNEFNDDSPATALYRLTTLLTSLGGLSDRNSLMAVLTDLPIDDVTYLREKVNDLPFGMDTTCYFSCTHCPEKFEMNMPMGASFFFPRIKTNEKKPN